MDADSNVDMYAADVVYIRTLDIINAKLFFEIEIIIWFEI